MPDSQRLTTARAGPRRPKSLIFNDLRYMASMNIKSPMANRGAIAIGESVIIMSSIFFVFFVFFLVRLFESFGKKLGAIKTRVDRLELIREIRGESCENIFDLLAGSIAKRKIESLGDCDKMLFCHNDVFCVFCVLLCDL